jgi:hypothetical protein
MCVCGGESGEAHRDSRGGDLSFGKCGDHFILPGEAAAWRMADYRGSV